MTALDSNMDTDLETPTPVKCQPTLDDNLEAKAVNFLQSAILLNQKSADAFLYRFASISDESLMTFISHVVVLLSTPNQVITASAMKMIYYVLIWCSAKVHLALVKADLVAQLITTLNPQSLPFAEAVDIHSCLLSSIVFSLARNSVWSRLSRN
ncbi:hypothetical protein BLNAU_4839 [Blattamonas nauphoetae]|uniref:Uncharacterized protein n=1 Tax=Blattamonas nauphoetae TaxID=2049346 RepID=A0ABQ9Y959_9EUKA|nr:hypothetical protein BLNAU_4839 [Blattamonas nauphoetae]